MINRVVLLMSATVLPTVVMAFLIFIYFKLQKVSKHNLEKHVVPGVVDNFVNYSSGADSSDDDDEVYLDGHI